jgi:hypothetical protein
LIEQALDQKASDQSETGSVDIENCPACLEEFASLGSLLRVAGQAMESTQPAESFWTGYHERLQESLVRNTAPRTRSRNARGGLIRLRNFFTASVRVPVPVAATLIVLFGLSVVLAMRSRRPSTGPTSGTASAITKTVEVPVIHERTVLRVVYRDRNLRTLADRATQPKEKRNASSAANRRNEAVEDTSASLAGFKPTNEAKLTIIKGVGRDEK